MGKRQAPLDERLAEFFSRLAAAPAARSFDEAFGQLHRILNQVEDERSGLPFDPFEMPRGGRLFPPMWDNIFRDPTRAGVWRLRSAGHATLVGDNGAIVVYHRRSHEVLFAKAGEDGRTVDAS